MGVGSFLKRTAGDIGSAGGDLWNDVTGKSASRDAANIQAGAANKATELQKTLHDENVKLNEPWRLSGVNALSDLAGGMKSGAFDAPNEEFQYSMPKDESFTDQGFSFNMQDDPGYKYRAQQQDQAVERSAAAGGGLFSGATLSDLASKRGEMASQEYGNAYARARGGYEADRNFGYGQHRDRVGDSINNRNFAFNNFTGSQERKRQGLSDRFSRLSSLAGLGEAATSRIGQGNTMYGQQAGENMMGAANAQAAGKVAGYNNQKDFLMGLGNLGAKAYGAA